MKNNKIMAGITIGDPNGIGIEVILKTFKDSRMLDFCTPIIFGSSKIISNHKKALSINDIQTNKIQKISEAKTRKINLLNLSNDETILSIGKPSVNGGEYAFKSLQKACDALKKNELDVLITAPINKHVIRQKQTKFIGHTEFLNRTFEGDALMLMHSEYMKIAFVTGHVPLSEVSTLITKEKIINKTILLQKSLKKDFGCIKPKIAILGLNPHAGENGMLGKEEETIISPAIKELKAKNILAFGPFSADSFFNYDKFKNFDGILAMYHDQGLIPFKSISFFDGINYTAGLDIIRTSPVHGTSYSIAGKNIANPNSFRQAVFSACSIFEKRTKFNKLN